MPATATDRLNGITTSVAVKPPCVAVTSANITLSGLQTIGGVVLAEGDRVLVRAQTSSVDNGIYNASTSGWTRAKDFDGARDVTQGTLVLVRSGIAQGSIWEVTTANPIVIGTSAIVFSHREDPAVTYVQTQAEIDALVPPANTTYRPGSWLRYGADPTGVIDSSTAISNAIKANAHSFDDYPGGGNYSLTSGVLISSFPRSITGQISDATGTAGTKVTLKTVAGAGAAAFTTAANKPGISFENIAVIHQTTTTGQISWRFGADARYCTLRRCVSVGAAAVASTSTGVQFDGTGTYSAFNVLDQCYFTGHRYSIDLQGTCTVIDILNCNFFGYTTSTGSFGLKCSNLSTYNISGGHIEGFNTANSRGIFSQGAVMRQYGIRYEANTVNWEWVRTAPNARIWGFALAEQFVSGGNPIYPINDVDTCTVLSGPGFYDIDTASLGAYRGFRELGLTTPMGYGTDYTPALAAGSGTLGSTAIGYAYYSRVGGSITVYFSISGTLSGSATTVLTIATPLGLFPAKNAQNPCTITNAGSTSHGLAYVNTSGAVINISIAASGTGNWTNGAVVASGQITFRIIS